MIPHSVSNSISSTVSSSTSSSSFWSSTASSASSSFYATTFSSSQLSSSSFSPNGPYLRSRRQFESDHDDSITISTSPLIIAQPFATDVHLEEDFVRGVDIEGSAILSYESTAYSASNNGSSDFDEYSSLSSLENLQITAPTDKNSLIPKELYFSKFHNQYSQKNNDEKHLTNSIIVAPPATSFSSGPLNLISSPTTTSSVSTSPTSVSSSTSPVPEASLLPNRADSILSSVLETASTSSTRSSISLSPIPPYVEPTNFVASSSPSMLLATFPSIFQSLSINYSYQNDTHEFDCYVPTSKVHFVIHFFAVNSTANSTSPTSQSNPRFLVEIQRRSGSSLSFYTLYDRLLHEFSRRNLVAVC